MDLLEINIYMHHSITHNNVIICTCKYKIRNVTL